MYAGSTKQTSKTWTRESLAWLAGIFEGEGYVQGRPRTYQRADGRSFTTVGFRLVVSMSDEDVIAEFHNLAGVGRINGPRLSPSLAKRGRKPMWDFSASGVDAYALAIALIPWLKGRRRVQVSQAINRWVNSPATYRNRSLLPSQVRRIRAEVTSGDRGKATELAKEFGTSISVVSLVALGKTYKDVV